MKFCDFVNTKMGTYNDRRFSNGNVYPVTAYPFGMTNFTIQTDGERGNWFYNPLSHAFEGIRLTHQPSPWIGDYGHILFLPFSGDLSENPLKRWTSYRPSEDDIRPYKIDVYLQRYGIGAKLTPTERGGYLVISNDNTINRKTGFALVAYAESSFHMIGENTVEGWTDSRSVWGFKKIREFFHIEFSEKIAGFSGLENGGVAYTFANSVVEAKVATSFISEEQAKNNFIRELSGVSYKQAEENALSCWERYLGKIGVSGENPQRKRTFYTCLYRALLYPRIFYEYDGNNRPVHFNADTAASGNGVYYTDNGFWDTYRTVYPLLSVIAPEKEREMIRGFVNSACENGWLPKWMSPGETGMMPGTLIEAVIADAAVKGVIDGDLRHRAYQYMLKNAYEKSRDNRFGRRGIDEYIRYGYVPSDKKECVNNTCDFAYGDFCVAQVAGLENDSEQYEKLLRRSKSYINIFDGKHMFLRGKDRDGNFRQRFNPLEWGGDNCEGGSWQNSFAVCHDIDGLVGLHGGKARFERQLDKLFNTPPKYFVGGYGGEIHEMSEMACADFGQCAISNQPCFHIPWLYAAIDKREKTEYWVEKLVNEAFSCGINGFPGDEDNGTTAGWYIFSCLGFYPLCPGKAEYIAGKPLFEELEICGKKIGRFPDKFVSHHELIK